MKKAELLYAAMLKTNKPTSLAFAVRDGVPFANLKDDSIEALALTVRGYEANLSELVAKLAEQPSPTPEKTPAAPPAPTPAATPVVVKAEDVTPPRRGKPAT